MAQTGGVKVAVFCQKGWAAQRVQQRDDFIQVFHPGVADLNADLSHVKLPAYELAAADEVYVFVEDNHAAWRWLAVFSSKAALAKATASAMASRLTRPNHVSVICSHGISSANISKTSLTKMRVPLKVNSPPQISGSETMYC